MSTPGFGEVRKQRIEQEKNRKPRVQRTYNPGKDVDRLLYIGADWGIELYELLEEVAEMDFLTEEDAETGDQVVTEETRHKTAILHSNATVILTRINNAAGRKRAMRTMEEGGIIQIAVTRKEQAFLVELGEYFDLGPEALEELRTLPAKGWY
tara:strand:+ start:273 stop:731 length:459 start_codon:yes stop_codon:yes gene_type:complete